MIEYRIPSRAIRRASFIERFLENNENLELLYNYNQLYEEYNNLLDENTEEPLPENKETPKEKTYKRDDKYIR
ncbi:hypothetical protein H8356DRAFT_599604 [Neocallimastix lanati (nom. inval.)]|uniref:Uncharacterized protein n=1 Tax=Neocallimastix californiae TaxID=1754190 RepID=A0A1Y2BU41_9FUNG|nr:hypothetical protein H8356DRAFT_599604 [Neocallimastix sp. JGI-2020a]ORY38269.1 hypothetical protein LY90DRAFT_704454 [Neocallimastix californiae]|eukprot:ORY38269.1 hypothetical protein LY90DRAFT_704454 [Neocallimastix californiae]